VTRKPDLVPPQEGVRPVDQSTLQSRRDNASSQARAGVPVPDYGPSNSPRIGFAPETTLPSAMERPDWITRGSGGAKGAKGSRSSTVTILIVLIVLAVLILLGLGGVAAALYLGR
jgi:hypothetical protein